MHKVILYCEASLVCLCVPGPQSICTLPVMGLWSGSLIIVGIALLWTFPVLNM